MAYVGAQPLAGNFKTLDNITTDGSQSYTLNYDGVPFQPGQAERLIVSLDGVTQAPNVAFTINGSTITFAAAIPATSTIDYIVALGEIGNVTTVADGAVTPAKLSSGLVLNDSPIRVNTNSVDSAVTVAANQNAFMAGPVTLNASLTVNGTFTVI